MMCWRVFWQRILSVSGFAAVSSLILMMLLTCADVFGRYVLALPIRGAFEGTTYLQAIVVLLAVALTQAKGGHVSVEILSSRFPIGLKRWVDPLTLLLLLGLGVVMTWKTGEQAYLSFLLGEYESVTTQFLPVWIVRAFVCVGFGLLSIEFLTEFVNNIVNNTKGIVSRR